MTENDRPWEFGKTGINPGFFAIQKQAARLATSSVMEQLNRTSNLGLKLETWNTAAIVGASLQSLRASLADTVVHHMTAAEMVGDSLKHFRDSIEPISHEFTRVPEALTKISESARLQHVSAIQRLVNSLKQDSVLSLASSLQNVVAPMLDRSIGVDEVPAIDLPKKEVHERLEKEATKEKEETGLPVPYNVLSMKFIFNVYLPCMDMAHSLDNVDSIDAEFAVRFFMFNVLPLIYYFTSKEKEPAIDKFDFDKDVVICEEDDVFV